MKRSTRRPDLRALATPIFGGSLCLAILYFSWAALRRYFMEHYHPELARSVVGYAWFDSFVLLAQVTVISVVVAAWGRSSRWPVRLSGAVTLGAIVAAHFVCLSISVTVPGR